MPVCSVNILSAYCERFLLKEVVNFDLIFSNLQWIILERERKERVVLILIKIEFHFWVDANCWTDCWRESSGEKQSRREPLERIFLIRGREFFLCFQF